MSSLSSIAAALARLAPVLLRSAKRLPLPQQMMPSGSTQQLVSALSQLARGQTNSRRTKRARFNLLQGGLSQTLAGLGQVGQGGAVPTVGQVGAGLSMAAGGAGIAVGAVLGGPAGAAVGALASALGKLGEVVFESIDKLRDWNRSLLDFNFRFAQFSASMSQVMVIQRFREMELSRRRGERLAPSAEILARGSTMLEERTQEIETFFARIKNLGQGFASAFVAGLFESSPLYQAIKVANRIMDKLDQYFGPTVQFDTAEWQKELGVEKWYEKFGRPSRFPSQKNGAP